MAVMLESGTKIFSAPPALPLLLGKIAAAGCCRGCQRPVEVRAMSEPSYDELKAKLAELEKQVQGGKRGNLNYKVSEKGGVSVYGLGRFPVTLYYEQWIRLLDQADQIREFLEENKSGLKMKNAEG
jgi:hypothetical protein